MYKKMRFMSILFLFTYCTPDNVVSEIESSQQLENVLTLELSFGDEKTVSKDEFLLVNPQYIVVNYDGDIYVLDGEIENWKTKVFDKSGGEKLILGGYGQGPGEYTTPANPIVSRDGFLTVVDNIYRYNIYSPDFKFLNSVRWSNDRLFNNYLDKNNFRFRITTPYTVKVHSINDSERIISLMTGNISPEDKFPYFDVLFYENPDSLIEIARYNKKIANLFLSAPFRGDLLWDVTFDNKVIYTHSGFDIKKDRDDFYYVLNIFSLEDFSKSQIIHKYIPIEIAAEEKERYYKKKYEDTREGRIHLDILKDTKFHPSLLNLIADRNFIFVFVHQDKDAENVLVDVFDGKDMKHLSSAYFPFSPEAIKNGYAYRENKNEEGFYIIEKYKIAPAVYGK
ncbi:hypothetical protein AMJ80_06770 [bacterium SM23_31]|nr:MAG: hypothetical protein AMJ80_06770 [bacterium SM23_31]